MNQNNLKEENLLLLLSLNNIIVPEIQREYVWGNNKNVVEKFLETIKGNEKELCCDKCKNIYKKEMNVGFLYSYKPSYAILENERYLDEYLIDGQQRFTTLFLLLLFLSVKENRIKEFLKIIRFNKEQRHCCFDYKVRNLTHDFLIDLLTKIEEIQNVNFFDELTEKGFNYNWFLNDYKNDMTVQSMLNTLLIIKEKFKDEYKYYDYILTKINFWHFKTEVTSQGEELYITMNSRGEVLSQNENQKGIIIQKEVDSKKWEEMQDFFWKNKGDNINADKGFNGFLNCIASLLNYIENKKFFLEKKYFDDNHISEKHYNCLKENGIENICVYYDVLKILYTFNNKDNNEELKEENLNWIYDIINEMKNIFNENKTNWFCDFNDPNNGNERNKMVFVWFIFELLKERKDKILTRKEIIRALRYIWLRYNNYDRSVTKLKEKVNMFINAKLNEDDEDDENKEVEDKSLQKEEKEKYKFLKIIENNKFNFEKDFEEKEKIIWSIEDHKLNLNAKYLNFTNISHLISFNEEEQELKQVKDTFFCLFPEGNNDQNYDNLVLLSLFYDYKGSNNFSAFDSKSNNRFIRKELRKFIREDIFKKIFNDIKDIRNNKITTNKNIKDILSSLLEEKENEFLKNLRMQNLL